jgi:hypothetical protein
VLFMDQKTGPGHPSPGRDMDAAAARVIERARAVARAVKVSGPPFPPERYAAACGVIEVRRAALAGEPAQMRPAGPSGREFVVLLDRSLPPHTPQWNGALAVALARTFLPAEVRGEAEAFLAETGAAEILLPMRAFRPVAARTDLTVDGLRALALQFAAPVRLTLRQWLRVGTWRGFALLWRSEGAGLRLAWRAASPGVRFPRSAAIGAPADSVWTAESRLYATLRTGHPRHGVEEVHTGAGVTWWFTRFGVVRDPAGATGTGGGRAVLALVALARR